MTWRNETNHATAPLKRPDGMGRSPFVVDCRTAALDQAPPAVRLSRLHRLGPDDCGRCADGKAGWQRAPVAPGGGPAGRRATTVPGPAQEPEEEVAIATADSSKAEYVESRGRLTAAVELISPRNKDRPSSRATYLARYVIYLLEGVNLLLVDVPAGRSLFPSPMRLLKNCNSCNRRCPPPSPSAIASASRPPPAVTFWLCGDGR